MDKPVLVKHKHSGIEYRLSVAAWAKISASSAKDTYQVLQQPEAPKEVKTVRPAKAITKAESDNTHGITTIDDRLSSQDAGEAE